MLSFRHMMEDIGSSVVVDKIAYQQFSDFAREKLRVQSYELPQALQLVNFRDLLKLQTYLEAVALTPSKKPATSLHLPHVIASPAELLIGRLNL